MENMKMPKLDNLPSPSPDPLNLNQSYKQRIRPLLDAVDTLRNLGVVKEGIRLPTIVVIGDQSSGKSSVLESLAGISLPTGQGICTRLPLIMRLQNCEPQECEIVIEYNGKKRAILEPEIKETLDTVTEEIAGSDKGISDTPVTLHVKKTDAPDLTMVDLPGIVRVAVDGQPRNIDEQVAEIIKQYITSKESIILNVLPATVDFTTCGSIKMSQDVDQHGERTLAAVTKVDIAPEGLLEKVTKDAVNIGHGYVCVRNRIGIESISEARQKERDLFRTNPHLSSIDESMVGIPVLAEKLMQIQAMGIRNCLPDIVKKIDFTLCKRQSELAALPRRFSSSADATLEFMKAMDGIKCMLNRITMQGVFEEFEDEPNMHCSAYLNRMFKTYSDDLIKASAISGDHFLSEEVRFLEEAQGITLPNFLPHPTFVTLLKNRIDSVSETSRYLAIQFCEYLEKTISRVIDFQTQSYPKLRALSRRAFQGLIGRKKDECIKYVEDMMEMEKGVVFTMSPCYSESLFKLQERKKEFIAAIKRHSLIIRIEDIGEIKLYKVPKVSSGELEAAFELKISLIAYWNVVRLRLADQIPLHLRFVLQKMVQNGIVAEIVKEVTEPGLNMLERVLDESPVISTKRKNLNNSVERLRQSKFALSKILVITSRISESMVGIPVLAEKLMQIQAMGIHNCLPDIVKKIDFTLCKRQSELAALPRRFSSSADATLEFMKAMDGIKCMLNRITMQGVFEEFEDEPDMHCSAYLNRMFKTYSDDLIKASAILGDHFLSEEIRLLEEAQGITLPNFLPHPTFVTLLKNHIDSVSETSRYLAIQFCEYLEKTISRVIDFQTQSYPKLRALSRRAFQGLIDRKKDECIKYVEDMMEMEKGVVFTMSPCYSESLFKLPGRKKEFIAAIKRHSLIIRIEGIGEIKLDNVPKVSSGELEAAFELKISLIAYWNVVRLRLADQIPLHLRFVLQKMVQNGIVAEIVKEVAEPGFNMMERVLDESPVISTKRKNLNNSVERLRQSKFALSKILGNPLPDLQFVQDIMLTAKL